MILIGCSLPFEIKPIISALDLKRNQDFAKWQVYENESFILLLHGVGKLKSAVNLTSFIAQYHKTEINHFVNIGICGSSLSEARIGTPYYINQIEDQSSSRRYYPDISFRHNFQEYPLLTVDKPLFESLEKKTLVDMEGSGIFEASTHFLDTHQIHLIKVVSDYLECLKGEFETALKIMETATPKIIEWLLELNTSASNLNEIRQVSPIHLDVSLMKNLSKQLGLTQTQEISLIKWIRYYNLNHNRAFDIPKSWFELKFNHKRDRNLWIQRITKEFASE